MAQMALHKVSSSLCGATIQVPPQAVLIGASHLLKGGKRRPMRLRCHALPRTLQRRQRAPPTHHTLRMSVSLCRANRDSHCLAHSLRSQSEDGQPNDPGHTSLRDRLYQLNQPSSLGLRRPMAQRIMRLTVASALLLVATFQGQWDSRLMSTRPSVSLRPVTMACAPF